VRREKRYYVYILASKNRVLYVGVTGFLMARILQHKAGECEGFTQKYKVNRLVYYEVFQYVNNALARETEINLAADWGKPVAMTRADSSPAKAGSE
jgi:putative endonuclease